MYKATQGGAQQGPTGGQDQPNQGGGSSASDHVEDAQFEEVK